MRAAAILVLCASLAACSQTASEPTAYTSEPAKPARTAAAEKPKPSPVAAKAAACDEAIKRQSNAQMIGGALGMVGGFGGWGGRGGAVAASVASSAGGMIANAQARQAEAAVMRDCNLSYQGH